MKAAVAVLDVHIYGDGGGFNNGGDVYSLAINGKARLLWKWKGGMGLYVHPYGADDDVIPEGKALEFTANFPYVDWSDIKGGLTPVPDPEGWTLPDLFYDVEATTDAYYRRRFELLDSLKKESFPAGVVPGVGNDD